jgi:hypothetical protein
MLRLDSGACAVLATSRDLSERVAMGCGMWGYSEWGCGRNALELEQLSVKWRWLGEVSLARERREGRGGGLRALRSIPRAILDFRNPKGTYPRSETELQEISSSSKGKSDFLKSTFRSRSPKRLRIVYLVVGAGIPN